MEKDENLEQTSEKTEAKKGAIPQELIDRINELSKKKKEGTLTEAEKEEQQELRKTYLAMFRENFRSHVEMLQVYDKDGNEISFIDIISTDEEGVFQQVENDIMAEKLLDIMKKILSDREYEIIKLRYGLQNSAVYTQIEIATMMKISRSYVSRIEKKALQKMKEYLIENSLV